MVSNHHKHFVNTLDTKLNTVFIPLEYGMQTLKDHPMGNYYLRKYEQWTNAEI